MRIFWLFCALGALLGCKQVSEPSGTAIALFCSTSDDSKTESLTVGEEVAVFACLEGTEGYFLEAARFIVGSDGRSLTYGSTVYYPDPKQAVTFTAYLPFGGTWDGALGTFSVPADQSKPEALKQADLCGATARSTPVATPVALAFRHLMARLMITTNKSTEKISFPNALTSGVLHAATAELVLADTRSEVWTAGKELIVPVQPLSRLVLTVAGIEYVFDGSVSLEAGKTTTLDLTLHPDTHTATLSGSSIAGWGSVGGEGNITQTVSNTLTVHWPKCHPQSNVVDRIVLTIKDEVSKITANYTVSNGISYANQTFTIPFASASLIYPYTIQKISFYQADELLQSCTDLLGAVVYKSGASTIGIKDPANAIKIGKLWWATGNLVASNAEAGAYGLGGCKVGAPMDGGLYFQFGSLIGWKGGALANGGTGGGMPQAPLTTNGTYCWGGAAGWSWANDAMVWPAELVGTKTAWANTTEMNIVTLTDYYFNYSLNWATAGQSIRDFNLLPGTGIGNLGTGRYAALGVGDPCTYYLGGTWRLPTITEIASITGVTGVSWIAWTTAGVTGRWATADQTFAGITGPGAWFGAGLNAGVGTPTVRNPFFLASGCRDTYGGLFFNVTTIGYCWSSSVLNAKEAYSIYVHELLGVRPQGYYCRANGFPVRCVSE